MPIPLDSKIIVTGAAGLIGQNLCLRLTEAGYTNIYGYDKHAHNTKILKEIQPNIKVTEVDLSIPGNWQDDFSDADVVVLNQAQIGGLDYEEFRLNNVVATKNILDACKQGKPPFVVHISSSVVNSVADDFYTRSKTEQENIVLATTGLDYCVLRPTLMFGWFDRKHLGWLKRFMDKSPIFPIPGNGKYIRQPLYGGDFCNVIIKCIEQQPKGEVFDISGHEKMHYIDIIKTIRAQTKAKVLILKIPYRLFQFLLWCAAKVMKDPPFTTAQLAALVIPEEFAITDWPERFSVTPTPFHVAVEETFSHPQYAHVELNF